MDQIGFSVIAFCESDSIAADLNEVSFTLAMCMGNSVNQIRFSVVTFWETDLVTIDLNRKVLFFDHEYKGTQRGSNALLSNFL